MGKRSLGIISILLALTLILCSCGGSKRSGEMDLSESTSERMYEGWNGSNGVYLSDTSLEYEKSPVKVENEEVRDNTKIIRTANLSLQSTEFDKTDAFIKELVEKHGGYFENKTVENGDANVRTGANTLKKATYTVRIPSEYYEEFLSGVNEGCHIVSLSQAAQDVAEQYFDTEQKLETLRNKHARLEELLKKAEDMSDIIELEDALSDTEYEINRYQGTLNKYDSLIGYSTIKISLKEVSRPDEGIDDDPTFFERIKESFSAGFERFTEGLKDLAYWITYNIFALVIIAAVIVVLIKVKPISRIKKKRAAKKLAKAEDKADK